MNTYLRFPTWTATILLLLLAAVVGSSCGCGGSDTETVMDASALLARYEKDRRRHDPLHFSEVNLGEFTVTQRHEPSIFYIRFHLHGVIPDRLVEQFNQLMETHHERVRAKVRESAQKCDLDQLNDPSLGWLKSELISSINRILQTPILRMSRLLISRLNAARGQGVAWLSESGESVWHYELLQLYRYGGEVRSAPDDSAASAVCAAQLLLTSTRWRELYFRSDATRHK